MNERRTLRGVVLAGAAGIGVLAGHWFAYVLAYPATSIRAEILASSGHGYWLWAVRCAAVLLVGAIGALVARHVDAVPGADTPRAVRFSWAATRLAAIQVASFAAMETGERLVAGASLHGMFAHDVLVFGLGLQVLIAFAIALLLVGLDRAAGAVVASVRAHARPMRVEARPVPLPAGLVPVPAPLLLAGAAGLRGPPLLSS